MRQTHDVHDSENRSSTMLEIVDELLASLLNYSLM